MGQRRPIHYFQSTNLPPGAVAHGQLLRGAPLVGYTQPVKILVPDGVTVSFNVNGQFDTPRPGPVIAGMQIGPVYQLRVTNIPFQAGMEVYPTIEVINRLYPPPGQAARFPIPIHLTREELDYALEGRFVTRVIYLEDRATALPHRDDPQRQRYFEAPPNQDPLRVADQLGRPMAILRMGSRVPDLDGPNSGWTYGHPPVILDPDSQQDVSPSDRGESNAAHYETAIERQPYNIPRMPVAPQTAPTLNPAGYQRPQ
jgi:hypothetical protein